MLQGQSTSTVYDNRSSHFVPIAKLLNTAANLKYNGRS